MPSGVATVLQILRTIIIPVIGAQWHPRIISTIDSIRNLRTVVHTIKFNVVGIITRDRKCAHRRTNNHEDLLLRVLGTILPCFSRRQMLPEAYHAGASCQELEVIMALLQIPMESVVTSLTQHLHITRNHLRQYITRSRVDIYHSQERSS